MTTIVIHRRRRMSKVISGLTSQLTALVSRKPQRHLTPKLRATPLDLDDRMLSDIGMSRAEFLAAELDG